MSLYRVLSAITALTACMLAGSSAPAQTLTQVKEKLHAEVHGYVAQAGIYSDRNNWNLTGSTDGSGAWTEAVVSLVAQPDRRLRVGAQGRFFRLGDYGYKLSLDWASAEFKVNERIGFRAGKVKTPLGMLNETQDIDPAHLWILLPQSIYPLASRSADLAHTGGIVFGTVPLGEGFGKVEYRAYGGRRIIPSDNGLAKPLLDAGITFPDGFSGPAYGLSLRWRTPMHGLMAGITEAFEDPHAEVHYGPLTGTLKTPTFNQTFYFARYERDRLMVAAEYSRFPTTAVIQFPYIPAIGGSRDLRAFYLMGSYKLAAKLTGGAYYSYGRDKGPSSAFAGYLTGPDSKYENDFTVSGRYDIKTYLYLKAEEHFLDGVLIGYNAADNPNGLSKTSHLSLVKLGVSF